MFVLSFVRLLLCGMGASAEAAAAARWLVLLLHFAAVVDLIVVLFSPDGSVPAHL